MENANNKNQSYKTKQNRGLLTRQQITDHHYARDARIACAHSHVELWKMSITLYVIVYTNHSASLLYWFNI